jgi:preprotein translocase subunit SecB
MWILSVLLERFEILADVIDVEELLNIGGVAAITILFPNVRHVVSSGSHVRGMGGSW